MLMPPEHSNRIFVFGSNIAGRHGKGAAKTAKDHYGAVNGVGIGPQGNCYAIPTKDKHLNVLPLVIIQEYVLEFLWHAEDEHEYGDLTFYVTPIGTGLTGYKHEEIAPFFKNYPPNCFMPPQWDGLY